jgi:hypothetical protein
VNRQASWQPYPSRLITVASEEGSRGVSCGCHLTTNPLVPKTVNGWRHAEEATP